MGKRNWRKEKKCKMAKTLDDIFNEDDFGLLDSNERKSVIKTDEDRLLESFEEINSFFEKNKREPSTSSIAEYSLLARLKEFRNNENKKNHKSITDLWLYDIILKLRFRFLIENERTNFVCLYHRNNSNHLK